jgi:hypothetical protein
MGSSSWSKAWAREARQMRAKTPPNFAARAGKARLPPARRVHAKALVRATARWACTALAAAGSDLAPATMHEFHY